MYSFQLSLGIPFALCWTSALWLSQVRICWNCLLIFWPRNDLINSQYIVRWIRRIDEQNTIYDVDRYTRRRFWIMVTVVVDKCDEQWRLCILPYKRSVTLIFWNSVRQIEFRYYLLYHQKLSDQGDWRSLTWVYILFSF